MSTHSQMALLVTSTALILHCGAAANDQTKKQEVTQLVLTLNSLHQQGRWLELLSHYREGTTIDIIQPASRGGGVLKIEPAQFAELDERDDLNIATARQDWQRLVVFIEGRTARVLQEFEEVATLHSGLTSRLRARQSRFFLNGRTRAVTA